MSSVGSADAWKLCRGMATADLASAGANIAVLDWTPGAAAATAEQVKKMGRNTYAFDSATGDEKTVVDALAKTQR